MNRMSKFIVILASISLPLSASAGVVYHQFTGNDCSGYFGGSFDACQIFINEDGQKIEISPVIAKYEFNDNFGITETETNDFFETFNGSEVVVNQSGTWTYSPGENDPGIRYWSAKGGNSFNLFWYVDDADEAACTGNTYTLTCLNLAQSVTGGTWSTPNNKGLSHFVVYDSEPPKIVPEPTTITLLLIGMAGLVMARRFKPGQSLTR